MDLLPLHVPENDSPNCCLSRTLLVRPYRDHKTNVERNERSLFVCQLNELVDKNDLWKLFSAVGKLDEVSFSKGKRTRARQNITCIAIIVFKTVEGFNKLMKYAGTGVWMPSVLPFRRPVLVDKKKQVANRWKNQGTDDLKAEVASFMKAYEEKERAAGKEKKQQTVDEDGFTLVKSGTTHAPDGTRVESFKPKAKHEWENPDDEPDRKKKKKSKEYDDFYSFQMKAKAREMALQAEKRKKEIEEELERWRRSGTFSTPQEFRTAAMMLQWD